MIFRHEETMFISEIKAMYKRKTEEDLDCGLYVTMKILGGKWKACIIDAIANGAHRPSEIHRLITATTPRVLDMQLRELLDYGVVTRRHRGTYPLYAEYHLTAFGKSLLPLLKQMAAWGDGNKNFIKNRTLELHASQGNEGLRQPRAEKPGTSRVQENAVCRTA